MDVTTQKRCLTMVAAGLIAGSVGAAVWAVSSVSQPAAQVSESDSRLPSVDSATEETVRNTDSLIAKRRLRRPLVDPPPPKPKPVPKPEPKVVRPKPPPPPPKLDVTLVGTIIQPNESLAIIADASGGFDIKGVGEPLELSTDGITIQRIDSEQVTLLYQGRQSTIELDRTATKPNNAAGKRGGNNRRRTNR